VAEMLLIAGGYHYSPLQIGVGNTNDSREEHAFRDRLLTYDPDLIWRPLTGQFSPFNPQGFRGAPVDPVKPDGRYRIIALGDSNTFGWTVDDGANWPAQLEGLFASSRAGTEVVNAGVWGYTMYQGLQRFTEVVPLSPDLVLVSYGGNDAHQVTVPDAAYVRSHDRIERITRLTRRLRLAQLGVSTFDVVSTALRGPGPLGPRVPLDDYVAYLRELIRTARARKISVVLLTRPFVGTSTDPGFWKTYAPRYNDATVEIGRSEHVPVIDIYEAFKDRTALFDDESHFGVEGHRIAAGLIHARLSDIVAASKPEG
jgi:lysophospholipase L1-like esterase